jgi:hypothetical protein
LRLVVDDQNYRFVFHRLSLLSMTFRYIGKLT